MQRAQAADAVAGQRDGRESEVCDEVLEPAHVELERQVLREPVRATEARQVHHDRVVSPPEVLELMPQSFPVKVAFGRNTIALPSPARS